MSNNNRVSSFSDLQVALAVDSGLGHQSVTVGRNVLSLLPIESEAEVLFGIIKSGLIMGRTIHYFQDGTDTWIVCDPIFPGSD